MKAIPRLFCLVTVLIFSSCKAQVASTDTNQPIGCRLTVELQDGSKIIGKGGDDNFRFRSDVLGEMKLPMENIRSVECQPKTNSVIVTTSKGDKLTAQFTTKEIGIETAFGKFKLPVDLVRRIQVSAMGLSSHSGFVALWSAENNANDVIGGNNGTLEGGATYAPGKVGQAFNLNGVTPCSRPDLGPDVQVPANDLWHFRENDFSITLWANFHSFPSGCARLGYPEGGVFVSSDEGSGGNNKWWFALDGNVLDVHLNGAAINGGSGTFLVQAPFVPQPGEWYHLAVTRSGNLYTIYVNGVAVGSQMDSHAIPDVNAPLTIGSAEGFYFNGLLDQVSIYNRALSAEEIQAMGKEDNRGEPLSPPQQSSFPQRPFNGQNLPYRDRVYH